MSLSTDLISIFDGWQGYNTSLIRAVESLTPEQLAFRPRPGMNSVGEIAAHIAMGRIDWFSRMDAPGARDLSATVDRHEKFDVDAAKLVHWLDASWRMVEGVLRAWTVEDLSKTYLQPYGGKNYVVSRQWVLWRIQAHDTHHGGQLTILLGMQGIDPPDLSNQGGHIVEPPLAEDSAARVR